VFVVWVFGSLYTVKPEEQAVELLFGEYLRDHRARSAISRPGPS
jgi:regulator of protease activity HflC (stomatin/prohibitin superfamily)